MTAAVLPRRLGWPMMDERTENQQILIEIAEALTRTTYLPLRQIELRYEAETVIMEGSVPTYFLKQLAQSAAMSVRGVGPINNQLRVTDGEHLRSENSVTSHSPNSVRETSWPRSRLAFAYV